MLNSYPQALQACHDSDIIKCYYLQDGGVKAKCADTSLSGTRDIVWVRELNIFVLVAAVVAAAILTELQEYEL